MTEPVASNAPAMPGFFRRSIRRCFGILRILSTIVGGVLLVLLLICFALGITLGHMSFTEVAERLYQSSPAQVFEGLSLAARSLGAGQKPKASDPPAPADTRDARWQQDLDYLVQNIATLHAIPWRYITREDWEAKALQLRNSIPAKTDSQLACHISALVALLGDGHTRINRRDSHVPMMELPIQIRSLANGCFVVQATKEHQRLVGAEILAINEHPITVVEGRTRGWLSSENHNADRANAEVLLRQLDYLKAMGICTNDEARIKLRLPKGEVIEVSLSAQSKLVWAEPEYPRAEYLKNRATVACYRFDQDCSLAIFQYNACRDRAEFRTIATSFWTEFDQAERKALVVDLRGNSGGDSSIIKPLLEGVEARGFNRRGRLFVLTDRDTYSSAFHGLMELRKRNAIHVGEGSAQKLNYGGDISNFPLPNSRLRVSYPTKDSAWLPGIDIRSVEPDCPKDPSSAEYFHGIDAVINEVHSILLAE